MLISPTEPITLRLLGTTSNLPESYGVDFLMLNADGDLVGVQRKEVKDFVASVWDGRMATQEAKAKSLALAIVIVEGLWTWTNNGTWMPGHRASSYTRSLHTGRCLSMQKDGIWLIHTNDLYETAEVLKDIEGWMAKDDHKGLSRPGPDKNEWGLTSNRDWGIHILQSFEGVGKELAGRIWDKFQGVPLKWSITQKELMEVEGLGKVRVKKLWQALTKSDSTTST